MLSAPSKSPNHWLVRWLVCLHTFSCICFFVAEGECYSALVIRQQHLLFGLYSMFIFPLFALFPPDWGFGGFFFIEKCKDKVVLFLHLFVHRKSVVCCWQRLGGN